METLYKTVNNNGEYSCGDIGVTVEEWLNLLHRPKAEPYIDALVCFLREPEQKGTCSGVGLKYGKSAQHYNSKVTNFSEWIKKELGRFRVVGTDGNPTYWCIAMQTGWDTKQGFVWQLRKELSEALRIYLMEKLIAKYKTFEPFNGYEELYKWELINKTEGKQTLENVIAITEKPLNIIDLRFCRGVLKDLMKIEPDKLSKCIFELYDESKPLNQRLAEYKTGMKEICPSDWRVYANDERTAAALLTCRYPELYTFYIDEFYQTICQYFGYTSKYAGQKYAHYIEIINYFSERFGEQIQQVMSNEIGDFNIKPNNLAIQTLLWCMKVSMTEEMKNENKSYWLLGHAFGSTNPQFGRFVKEGIWEGRFDANKKVDKRQLDLVHKMKVGDIVLLKSTAVKAKSIPFMRIKAIGIIRESIIEKNGADYKSCTCKVEYLSVEDKDFEGKVYGSYRQTIHRADTKVIDIVEYANNIINPKIMPQQKYKEYIELLKETHNLVLTGAPGTGKTYMAQEISKEMGAETEFVQFHPSYDYTDFVEGLRPIEKTDGQMGFERKDGVFKEFCKKAIKNLEDSKKTCQELKEEKTLEEKYNEVIDLIEGGEINDFSLKTEGKKMKVVRVSDYNNIILRTPGTTSDRTYTVSYDRIAKLAKAFPTLKSLNDISNISDAIRNAIGGCNASSYWAVLTEVYKHGHAVKIDIPSEVERKDFVFIIDEINRGEASKIFGELFYAIDPGYRGKKDVRVKTQYQNLVTETDVFAGGFYVPENVYILATMNDIDRSVESMDFAMRRRFTWKEVTPADTESMLDDLGCADEAKARMARLNESIADTDGLGAAYQVGPSYFLKLRDNGGDFDKLWKMNIEPLLKEYLRGFRKTSEILVKFKEAYFTKETAPTANDNSDLFE